MATISDIDVDVLSLIFSEMTQEKDLESVLSTCKHWRSVGVECIKVSKGQVERAIRNCTTEHSLKFMTNFNFNHMPTILGILKVFYCKTNKSKWSQEDKVKYKNVIEAISF